MSETYLPLLFDPAGRNATNAMDLFAALAPNCPEWFSIAPLVQPPSPPVPKWHEKSQDIWTYYLTEGDIPENMLGQLRKPARDRVREYVARHKQWRAACDEASARHAITREVEWRWFYARQMMKVRKQLPTTY